MRHQCALRCCIWNWVRKKNSTMRKEALKDTQWDVEQDKPTQFSDKFPWKKKKIPWKINNNETSSHELNIPVEW